MAKSTGVLPFVVGGVIGAALGSFGAFWLLFAALRLASELSGSDQWMFVMWLGVALLPLAALTGFAVGGALM